MSQDVFRPELTAEELDELCEAALWAAAQRRFAGELHRAQLLVELHNTLRALEPVGTEGGS